MLAGEQLSPAYLLAQPPLKVLIFGPEDLELDQLILEFFLQVNLLRDFFGVFEFQVDNVLLEVHDVTLGHILKPLEQILIFLL